MNKWLAQFLHPIGQTIWHHAPVILNLILASILAYAAWSTDRTTTEQVKLLSAVKGIFDEEVVTIARDDFTRALDDAEGFCVSCSSCSPAYLIGIPLDKAVCVEPRAAKRLTAAEYNRLAALGSFLWDFQTTKQYANKALNKSNTALDRFVSELVLGHIHFRHFNNDPTHANLDTGRKHFKAAIASLQLESGNDAAQYNMGEGYALWASHESFLSNEADCKQMRDFAETSWSKLPNCEVLVKKMDDRIKTAKSGIRPEIACFFKTPSQTCQAPVVFTPEPAPTPEAPAPVPTLAPAPTTNDF